MTTLYRIYDHTDRETLANKLSDLTQAQITLELLRKQYPTHQLEIEKYTVYTA